MTVLIDLIEKLRAKMVLDQTADELMVKFLLEVFDVVHDAFDLNSATFFLHLLIIFLHGHYYIFLSHFSCLFCNSLVLHVITIDLKEILTNKAPEFCLKGLRQMFADVPDCRTAFIMRFLDTTIIVSILKQKDAPVFLGNEIQVLEHLALFNLLDHEVDVVLGLFKVALLGVQPYLVEVSMDNLAAELLELV